MAVFKKMYNISHKLWRTFCYALFYLRYIIVFGWIYQNAFFHMLFVITQRAKTLVSTLIRYWTNTFVSDRYLIDIDPRVLLSEKFTLIKLMACWLTTPLVNSFPLDKMAADSQTIFSDVFSWMKSFAFGLKFNWSLFLRVQLSISQHWFR